MGGTTPLLAPRVAVLSNHMGCMLTPEEIMEDFKSFYYESALSAHEASLAMLDAFVKSDHILFGTDFPGKCVRHLPCQLLADCWHTAVSMQMAEWYSRNVEDYYADDREKLEGVMYENATKLFPRLQAGGARLGVGSAGYITR